MKLQIVQEDRLFRRSVIALGALAFACFLVALVQPATLRASIPPASLTCMPGW